MRALVTGGAGFIGSTLVDRLLAEGHAVDVVDDLSSGSLANLAAARGSSGEMTFHQLDIRGPELGELTMRRRPEVIFHLAAQTSVVASVAAPLRDADVNILGSLRVLDAARKARVRKVVFAASGGSLYGDVDPSELPVNEHHRHDPQSPYGVSKRVVIEYLTLYRQLFDLEFTALALSNVYGPRQDSSGEGGVVAIFAANLIAGATCRIYGNGEQTRDFVFVDDVVDAFSRAADRGSGLVLNIGTGQETSVNTLYAALARSAGVVRAARHEAPRPGELERSALDPGRSAIHLGWKPWTSLDDGVVAVLSSMRDGQERR
ncbi:MAG TPA: NAD-dependent epimerase/dehydratase family protein [Acidimicrobiales bacterium]|nr:NAD-dependent epimerase/dehydratase family protein [Acidimicrobiales bacterium]